MKKVILISGGSSSLGETLTKELSKRFIVYSTARNPRDVEKRRNIVPLKLDITNERNCKESIETIIKNEGRIDVLINNAGYTLTGPTSDFATEEFLKILDTNTVGAFRLIKYAVPYMKGQKRGRIINITSLNGLISLPNFGLYSSSKHALEALGTALHYELAKYGVFVTNLAPGAIFSDEKSPKSFSHKPAREKFRLLYFIMPMVTRSAVAEKIKDLIDSPKPPVQVIMGSDAKITTFLKRFLPTLVWDRLMAFIWNRK